MISAKMNDAINQQINAELYSSYMYYAMVSYFEDMGLSGFATWMKVQVQEEVFHANKMFEYVNERGGRVQLMSIEAPPSEWDSPMAVFDAVLEHEQKVTSLINGLVDVANSENDHAAKIFLQWFVEEQVEEEASVSDILSKLRLTADYPGGLFMMDKELGTRVFTVPV